MRFVKNNWYIAIPILLITLTCIWAYAAAPTYTYTPTHEPSRFNLEINSVEADDTFLVENTTYWSNLGDFVSIPPAWEKIQFAFYGYGDGDGVGDPNGGSFSFVVWAACQYSNAEIVYWASATIGECELSHDPVTGEAYNSTPDPNYKWADAIDVTDGDYSNVWSSAVSDPNDVGFMSTLVIDTHGYPYWYVQIDSMTAQPVTSVTCIARKYD